MVRKSFAWYLFDTFLAEEEDIVRNLTEKNQAVLDTNQDISNVETDIKTIVQEMKVRYST